MWNLSCPDWRERIRSGASLVPQLPLFQAEADMAVAFFNGLHLPDVPDKPLLREAAGDWYRDIVAALFGSRDPDTNIRHIPEIFAMVPKGNSKTTNGAGLMMTALLMNTRPRAEFLLVAPSQAISDLAFAQCVGMVEADPELVKRFHVREHLKEIRDRLNGSKLKIKTFGLDILTGPKPAGTLLDELHLLGKDRNTAKVLRQLRGGREKVSEGFLLIITTQSDEPPAGAFKDELMMARAIRDGRFAGRTLPILYEFPEDIAKDPDRWQDPTNWPMVMPNLGRSIRLDSLQSDWEAEKAKGPHAIAVWASQHLNIEIGMGLQTNRWAGADIWLAAAEDGLTLETLLERSEVVVVGVDGGGLDDLMSLAVIGREKDTRRWLVWGKSWAHPIVLERRKDVASTLLDFVKAGDLWMVETVGQDLTEAADLIEQIEASGKLAEKAAIGVDPVGVGQLIDEIAARGIDTQRIVPVSQGWKLSGAIKTTERKLADGTLAHAGQALVAWAVSNAKVEPRGNAITITKQVAGSAKIDPIMAIFDAVALMSLNPEPAGGKSYLETSELLLL